MMTRKRGAAGGSTEKSPRASKSSRPASGPKQVHSKCEDLHHGRNSPHEDLRKRSKDGVVRCSFCRVLKKRLTADVGTRGLDIVSYFERRTPAKQIQGSSPSEQAESQDGRASIAHSRGKDSSNVEDAPTANPLTSVEQVDSSESDTQLPASQGSSTSEFSSARSTDLVDTEVCKCIGCDDCPRWFAVDTILYEHWRSAPFVCSLIGEACEDEESHTRLVNLPGPPGMRRRDGMPGNCQNERTYPMQAASWDIFRRGSYFSELAAEESATHTFAAPLGWVSSSTREAAEDLLFAGFAGTSSQAARDSISRLLGLRARHLNLRSGRGHCAEFKRDEHSWLLWQETDAKREDTCSVVAAAVLVRQQHTCVGPKHLQGGMVLEYIASQPKRGKAFLLVQAGVEVCRLMGHTELFSACDMNQTGQAFDGKAPRALTAHQRWGFQEINPKEWRDRRFDEYTRQSNVKFMVKVFES
eukprot:TRINITY_DN32222_c0_g1_i1.p1 TRINITY_DN32222_c0_g1~~TRINITY_DN32222_c0_g1_i1.p1  ORF type:complete len:470 (-),score=56.34 TRINITY_DN32222_c0_g1_i1:263-1672(-)